MNKGLIMRASLFEKPEFSRVLRNSGQSEKAVYYQAFPGETIFKN